MAAGPGGGVVKAMLGSTRSLESCVWKRRRARSKLVTEPSKRGSYPEELRSRSEESDLVQAAKQCDAKVLIRVRTLE